MTVVVTGYYLSTFIVNIETENKNEKVFSINFTI